MDTTPIGNPIQLGTTQPTGQFSDNTPVPLPLDIPAPVAASDVKPETPDGTPVHDVVFTKAEKHPILKHFEYDHLPLHLQGVSREFHALAHKMHDSLPMGAELIAGLRKLLEAKDCMVRAANEL